MILSLSLENVLSEVLMMKKYRLIGLLVLAVVLVVSCAPKEGSTETALDTAAEETPEEELLGEEETDALAGQAINRGCRTRKVDSCTSKDDGSIVVELKGKTKLYKANCRGSRNAYTYRCREGGKPAYEYCRTQCEAGERCSEGQCVAAVEQCSDTDPNDDPAVRGTVRNAVNGVGNRVAEISDKCTVIEPVGKLIEFSCGPNNLLGQSGWQDCPEGQQCQDGACVAQEIQAQPFCYYLNSSGQRLPAGTGFYDTIARNYRGVVTEVAEFANQCDNRTRISEICNGGRRWEMLSGENTRRQDSPLRWDCQFGCQSGRCCQKVSTVSVCDGTTEINTTTTDCGGEPDVVRMDCARLRYGDYTYTCYQEEGIQKSCNPCGKAVCERSGVKVALTWEASCAQMYPSGEWVDTGRVVTGPGCP